MDCTAITRAKQTELATLADEINTFTPGEQATNRRHALLRRASVRQNSSNMASSAVAEGELPGFGSHRPGHMRIAEPSIGA